MTPPNKPETAANVIKPHLAAARQSKRPQNYMLSPQYADWLMVLSAWGLQSVARKLPMYGPAQGAQTAELAAQTAAALATVIAPPPRQAAPRRIETSTGDSATETQKGKAP